MKVPVLIFVQSKERAKQLYEELVYDGLKIDVIHAERSAAQRTAIINRFRTGEIWFLICTDLMARGYVQPHTNGSCGSFAFTCVHMCRV